MTYIIIDSKNKFLFQQCGYTIVMPYIYAHTKNLTAFLKKKIIMNIVRTQFVAQAQNGWDVSPMSPIQ